MPLFAKPLINQLIAIIQSDQAAGLAAANAERAAVGNAALDPIAEFHKGPGTRTAFPWLTLSVDGVTFEQEAEVFTRQSKCKISLVLDVGQFDQEMAQDNAQDYARMLDMIVTSA